MLRRTAYGQELGDILAIERRTDVRVIVNVPGRYTLASKRDAQGERRAFACKVLNMSPRGMALIGPVAGPVGDRVLATVDHFGNFEGAIVRHLKRGFVMSLKATDEQRAKLSSKLIWFDQYRNHDVADSRVHGRVVPKNPCSTLVLADGRTLTCLVIDMSVSGAAISADFVPPVGAVVAVGQVIGRVVRQFAEGFAVQFVAPEHPRTLEERLIKG